MTPIGYTNITPEQALTMLKAGDIKHVLDTRELHEWTAQRIGGAALVPVLVPVPSGEAQVLALLQQLNLPKDEPVLVHCRSGARSLRVMPQILAYGFQQVYHLPGGIISWTVAGLPTDSGPAR